MPQGGQTLISGGEGYVIQTTVFDILSELGNLTDDDRLVVAAAVHIVAQMGDDELRQAVQAAIVETGASSVREMGKVMGPLTKSLAGRATAGRISQVVKELLGGGK